MLKLWVVELFCVGGVGPSGCCAEVVLGVLWIRYNTEVEVG